MTRPCRRLVVGRTMLTGHDTGRRRGWRGLVVRIAGELIGRGCGGGGARSWYRIAGCGRSTWVVIASCGVIGAERSCCCVAGNSCRRGALLGPGARVTCRRKDAYILVGQKKKHSFFAVAANGTFVNQETNWHSPRSGPLWILLVNSDVFMEMWMRDPFSWSVVTCHWVSESIFINTEKTIGIGAASCRRRPNSFLILLS